MRSTYRDELKFMTPLLNGVLTRHHIRLKRASVSALTCVATYFQIASLTFGEGDLKVVLASFGSWASVGPQLARVTATGPLGNAIFGFCRPNVDLCYVRNEIDVLVNELLELPLTDSRAASSKYKGDAKFAR